MRTPLDPYSVLGVAPSAAEAEVKAAYRARSRLLHPDVHRDAQGRSPQAAHDAFTQLCAAYELALGNLDRTRSTLAAVDTAPAAPAPRPAPRVATVATASGPPVQVAAGVDWRGPVLLVGLALLGLLFFADWLPALFAYSAG